ncbi:hypothetical protein MPSEU_000390300 [Mayamaea pseudoterrestris]|nr:hypothetical protein MPSEU_000390300 [Mayamaea pseudoterrestris]
MTSLDTFFIVSSMHFEDLDHSIAVRRNDEVLALTHRARFDPATSTVQQHDTSNQNIVTNKVRSDNLQQFEFGNNSCELPTIPASRPQVHRRCRSSDQVDTSLVRESQSSDQLNAGSLHGSSSSGIRPPQRSKSSDKEIQSLLEASTASRRGRRPAPRAKSMGQTSDDVLDNVVTRVTISADAPVNKLSALQRSTVKRDLGPKKESRRLGLSPPVTGAGDGLFKAKAKAANNQSNSDGRRSERTRSAGFMGLMKG